MPILPHRGIVSPALASADQGGYLPGNADERDRAKFKKAASYMVLLDDKVGCKNMRCRKQFDISGIKTTAFL